MTDNQPMNPIIRRMKFIVSHSVVDKYGNLIVTSMSGVDYKIGVKRTQLFDVFQPDTEVVVGYASYKNRDYIAEATPANQLISADTPIQEEAPAKIISKSSLPSAKEKVELKPEPAPQAVGMTTKEIGEMIRAGKLKDIFSAEIATELVKWYQSQILGTTRISFDSSKLPKFMVKSTGKEE